MDPKKQKIIFLDVDGVMHRGNAFRDNDTGEITTGVSWYRIFEFEPHLAAWLKPFPDVKIVLSTSWITMPQGAREVTSRLSESLASRVIGDTFGESGLSALLWGHLDRGAQIKNYCVQNNIDDNDWVAIDDRADGFDGVESNLICTYEHAGLGDITKLDELRSKLIQWACEAAPASSGLQELDA